MARFIVDVIEELDLESIYMSYRGDGRGMAAYPPLLMVRVLLYGYRRGVSSRKIERATFEDVAFRFLSTARVSSSSTSSRRRRVLSK